VVFEQHEKFGQETSSRNSEVIHAGIYYPAQSLKAKLCVEGNSLLYDFCKQWDLPCNRFGKLIVANSGEEIETLEDLWVRGKGNGVLDLRLLDGAQVSRLEPEINARAALYSPSTGVVDSHQLMKRLEWLAQKNNAILAYNHKVTEIEPGANRHTIGYHGPNGLKDEIQSSWIINSAGLQADHIAGLMGIDIDEADYRLFLCKGEYFQIPFPQSRLVSRLIYPPPYKDLRGLGIHVTKSLDGRIKLGPNAFYVDDQDYTVDPDHREMFYEGIKEYLPFLKPDDLQPDMAGIRPKLQAPDTPIRDFVVCHEKDRGLNGVINLIGIESPGLTSCLSLANMVADLING
jgi:L-2-hydroxyglutarate oxidase LhgO